MKKKQLYGRGVLMLCIACQLTVAPLFFSSHVQAVPVAPTFLTTAQTQEMRTIKGIVRDVNNQPLPGATIRIKGTSTGVVSDVLIFTAWCRMWTGIIPLPYPMTRILPCSCRLSA